METELETATSSLYRIHHLHFYKLLHPNISIAAPHSVLYTPHTYLTINPSSTKMPHFCMSQQGDLTLLPHTAQLTSIHFYIHTQQKHPHSSYNTPTMLKGPPTFIHH